MEFILLPNDKINRTFLAMDFLHNANIVLETANKKWHFSDKPQEKFYFVNEYEEDSMSASVVEVVSYALHEDDGKNLNSNERNKFNDLLKNYEKNTFNQGNNQPHLWSIVSI